MTQLTATGRWILLISMLAVMCSGNVTAQKQELPAWLQPDVLKASVEIGMSEEQLQQFRAVVSRFLDGRMKAINKLMRGHNVTNMDRKLKSKTNSLKKKMDKEMAEFLTEEQLPKYGVYRDLLVSKFRI
ncbi:MAG: hypothetical protein QF921_16870 [Pseudomonadales bacterium]|nr:hypothetical protein [Pseudomonadales bacterium]MDP6471112.1 hypothetical protein [Pseudomonadales bacterium]MDP6825702.1 hypothetical protein [Pseudomonadales bacterium]MDP6973158.1 hypothetical protein [Pseudomonadales bacterium]